MTRMSKIAEKRHKEAQDKLREYLSNQKLVQHVIKRIDKMANVRADAVKLANGEIVADVQAARLELDKLKSQNADSLKLINKFLPDLKVAELHAEVDINKPTRELSDAELMAIATSEVTPAQDDDEE